MAVELITGVGTSDHISSNDFRAFNRANFGQGRYILKDAENMEINVSPSTGVITISEGSCMWSGMHIRLSSAEQIRYTVPSAAQTIYVYLHYTKDVSTGVESVDFEVKQGIKLTSTIDNLNDNTVEAYTLFCSFAASPTSFDDLKCDFKIIKSHEELEKDVATSQEDAVLFDGNIVPGTLNLSESMNNFKYIIFECTGKDKCYHTILFSDYIRDDFAVSVVGNGKWSNKAAIYTVISNIFASKISETEIKVSYTSETRIDVSVETRYGSDGMLIPMRIIGRERR
jgi:uncharacterized alkaline shock family protein YloU